MTKKPSRLTVLIDPLSKKEFEELCAQLENTPSGILRELIAEFLETDDKTKRVLPAAAKGGRKPRDGESH